MAPTAGRKQAYVAVLIQWLILSNYISAAIWKVHKRFAIRRRLLEAFRFHFLASFRSHARSCLIHGHSSHLSRV